MAQGLIEKAVAGGRVTAADVAQFVFDALEADRFYIYSHPKALAPVMTRAEDILARRQPVGPVPRASRTGRAAAGGAAALTRWRSGFVPSEGASASAQMVYDV